MEFLRRGDRVLRLKFLAVYPPIEGQAERDVFLQVDGQYRQ